VSEGPLSQLKKLAEDMTAGRIGLIEGVRVLVDLRHSLFAHGASDPDFKIIMDFERDTCHLPVGSVRQYWAPSALAEKDVEISALQLHAHARVPCLAGSVESTHRCSGVGNPGPIRWLTSRRCRRARGRHRVG
jgi:hypothetical protein